MGRLLVPALRVMLAGLFAGSVFVQTAMTALFAKDLEDLKPEYAYLRTPILTIVVLCFVAIQVVLVCTWRLLTMVRRGTVFTDAAFRYVDVIIGSIVAGALLIFAFGALLAPGEAAPPGFVLLVGGGGVATLGIAFVVGVIRMLHARPSRARSRRRSCGPSWPM